MLFRDVYIRATQIDELVAFICGWNRTTVKDATLYSGNKLTQEGEDFVYEKYIQEMSIDRIVLECSNNLGYEITVDRPQPRTTIYTLELDESQRTKVISGIV